MSDVFNALRVVNVNSNTEKKNGLTYLSWAWAWDEVKRLYPDASYKVVDFDSKPYLYDESLGYMVQTEVTICGETLPMHLPVMDGANNAMKSSRYSYKVKEYINRQATGNFIDKWVEPATMFDINKTIMRCLVKNLAMFGLGLYIYAGEDLPDIPVSYLSDGQVDELSKLILAQNYTVESACGVWGIQSLSAIPASEFNNVINTVKGWS